MPLLAYFRTILNLFYKLFCACSTMLYCTSSTKTVLYLCLHTILYLFYYSSELYCSTPLFYSVVMSVTAILSISPLCLIYCIISFPFLLYPFYILFYPPPPDCSTYSVSGMGTGMSVTAREGLQQDFLVW